MRVDKCFNKRSAPLVEVGRATIDNGHCFALGVRVRFFPIDLDVGRLSVHLTPKEAIDLAVGLIRNAAEQMRE